MSYIRTKDGRIIDTTKYPEHPASWGVQASDYALTIKQADTIEELCDEFVLFYMETKNSLPIPWATYEQRGVWKKEKEHIINEITNHPPYREPILYGAIWTSKGLIYVAKMNDDGKLELI